MWLVRLTKQQCLSVYPPFLGKCSMRLGISHHPKKKKNR